MAIADYETADDDARCVEEQINVPPNRPGALWKVITRAVRCPQCGSTASKARTGKRVNSQQLFEQYRQCSVCRVKFRVILE